MMSSVDRIGIEDLILSSRGRELSYSRSLRLAVELAIPILLGVAYIALVFLSSGQ